MLLKSSKLNNWITVRNLAKSVSPSINVFFILLTVFGSVLSLRHKKTHTKMQQICNFSKLCKIEALSYIKYKSSAESLINYALDFVAHVRCTLQGTGCRSLPLGNRLFQAAVKYISHPLRPVISKALSFRPSHQGHWLSCTYCMYIQYIPVISQSASFVPDIIYSTTYRATA